MSPDDGGVDHRVFVVRIVSQRFEKTLPYAGLRPPREPRMNILSCRSVRANRATAHPSGTSK